MTGPEHYIEAERLLTGQPRDYQTEANHLAEAQIHATLALAAATALNEPAGGLGAPDYDAWHKAASVTGHEPR